MCQRRSRRYTAPRNSYTSIPLQSSFHRPVFKTDGVARNRKRPHLRFDFAFAAAFLEDAVEPDLSESFNAA